MAHFTSTCEVPDCHLLAEWINFYETLDGRSAADALCAYHLGYAKAEEMKVPRGYRGRAWDYYLPIVNIEHGGEIHIHLERAWWILAGENCQPQSNEAIGWQCPAHQRRTSR